MPSPVPFHVTTSLRRRGDDAAMELVAGWTGATPCTARPLPTDRPLLVLTCRGPRLHVAGSAPVWWHPGLIGPRLAYPERDAVARALDLRAGDTVVDATLGLGHDALVLAARGAKVVALERVAPLLWFTADGMWRHYPALTRRVSFVRADHGEWLRRAADDSADHVFLDPMFPPGRAGTSHNLAPLRGFAQGGLGREVLDEARRVARRNVLLRLAPGEALPPGARPAGSRRVAYALWRRDDPCGTWSA